MLLELEESVPSLDAHLDEHGNLHVGMESVGVLTEAFDSSMSASYADRLRHRIDANMESLRVLLGATSHQRATDPLSTLGETDSVLCEMVTLVILGKFLPERLLEMIDRSSPEVDPPFPSPSPGALLAADLESLSRACSEHGWTGGELVRSWPEVSSEVSELVNRFADAHTGYGPLAWEAPGFDDPAVVVGALETIVTSRDNALSLPAVIDRREPSDVDTLAIYRLLESWLLLLEMGILSLRRAFYTIIVPLAGLMAKRLSVSTTDIAFMSFEELLGEAPSPSDIQRRRATYRGAKEYLTTNGIDPKRIERLMTGAT